MWSLGLVMWLSARCTSLINCGVSVLVTTIDDRPSPLSPLSPASVSGPYLVVVPPLEWRKCEVLILDGARGTCLTYEGGGHEITADEKADIALMDFSKQTPEQKAFAKEIQDFLISEGRMPW